MTDLKQQAQELASDWKGHYAVSFRDRIHAALAAARAEGVESERVKNAKIYFLIDRDAHARGEEEMREKAAHAVEVQLVSAKHGEWLWKVYFPRIIRAIPLTSEK